MSNRASGRSRVARFPGASSLGRSIHAEVGAVGMVEDQRADAGFGLHHHAFGELTPISSGRSSFQIPCWSSRLGQAG